MYLNAYPVSHNVVQEKDFTVNQKSCFITYEFQGFVFQSLLWRAFEGDIMSIITLCKRPLSLFTFTEHILCFTKWIVCAFTSACITTLKPDSLALWQEQILEQHLKPANGRIHMGMTFSETNTAAAALQGIF